MVLHVRYKSLYISLPSSVQQQRQMTKFCVFWRTRKTATIFSYFHLELKAGAAHLARVSSETNRSTKLILTIAKFEGKLI